MGINLNLKSFPNAIKDVLAKLKQNIDDVFSRSESEGMGLKKFERELREVFTEAERGVVAEKLAQGRRMR